jgi:type IV pilus assembly protein PilW
MMLSLMIFILITLFSYQLFKADHKVFIEQEEVVDMQQNARVALDILIRDLRIAGAGVPLEGVDADIGFLYPVIPGDGGEGLPDTLTVLANFNHVSSELNLKMPNESAEIKVNDSSEFTVGAVAIISGLTQECGESAEVFQITQISDDGQNLLQHHQSPPWNIDQKLNCTYIPVARVTLVNHRKYYIENADTDHPRLVMIEDAGDVQVIADNIENLQLVYNLVTGEKNESDPDNPGAIRKATITIVARTNTQDKQWNNGVHSLSGLQDNLRRLELQSDVQIRNLNR